MMIEVVKSHLANYREQLLHLSPNLVAALEALAESEGTTLEMLLISLINEALVHRLNKK